MKLLYDQNLSPVLVAGLGDLFPQSVHVRHVGLASADDVVVWQYARDHQYIIVSKDDDFHVLAFLRGAPPKVIGIRLGNATTQRIASLMRMNAPLIQAFIQDEQAAYLMLPQ